MKKILMVVAIAATSIALVACGGSSKPAEGESTETEVVAEEEVVEETPAATTSGSIVEQYQVLCDKMVELAQKVKAGDAAATQEYQKVAQDFANFAQENQDAWSKLTAEEIQKIQEIATKAAEAMQ